MPDTKQELVIITIHGIRWTRGSDWQNKFSTLVENRYPEIRTIQFRYGWVFAISSWLSSVFPFVLKRVIYTFQGLLKRTVKKFPNAKIAILAHSYGGYVAMKAIEQDGNFDIDGLESVVFMHCPIPSYIEDTNIWSWLEWGRVKRVYSWSSKKDNVIGKIAIKPFGQNGYWGFMRVGNLEDRKIPAYKPYPIALYNFQDNENHGGGLSPETNLNKYFGMLMEQLVGIKESL